MGNVLKPWVKEVSSEIISSNNNNKFEFNFKELKENRFNYWIKNIIFERILYNKKIKYFFLRYKGLSKKDATNY
jgi:hypothetical protein